ncbi:MAG: VOC family protein [Spirochaetes bacterium]|nr:VOC family protein [Spirochaetota bacterium]
MIIIETINHVGVTVSNLENSIKFYKELFDFEVVENNSKQAFIREGEILLCLIESADYKVPKNAKNRVSFSVDEDDFEDAVKEINNKGLTIVQGPENIRDGQSVIFLDPDGNQIEISYPKLEL